VRVGGAGSTIPLQAARGAGAGADLVIVWGSRNDPYAAAPPAEVHARAVDTYRMLRLACPAAPLLVCGPQWGATEPPGDLVATRNAVADAATSAGATFLDPSRWFIDRDDLMLPDGIHPTAAGHAHAAELLSPELSALLAPPAGPDLEPAAGWGTPLAVPAATIPPGSLPSGYE
jgi:lysophospholipase L1-like esterase